MQSLGIPNVIAANKDVVQKVTAQIDVVKKWDLQVNISAQRGVTTAVPTPAMDTNLKRSGGVTCGGVAASAATPGRRRLRGGGVAGASCPIAPCRPDGACPPAARFNRRLRGGGAAAPWQHKGGHDTKRRLAISVADIAEICCG